MRVNSHSPQVFVDKEPTYVLKNVPEIMFHYPHISISICTLGPFKSDDLYYIIHNCQIYPVYYLLTRLWEPTRLGSSLKSRKCGKIGFLPDELCPVGIVSEHWFMCRHGAMRLSLTHPNLFWRLSTKNDASCVLGVSWKVPWYSAKKYSGTFYEVPWGTIWRYGY